ncbi:MAG: UDP-N-acetylmuramoyl-tripeptide--D-alanyl-D-alanine ligase [Saprospiraceae bacterium]|nr:UDP-N-acetylmuramoyl-tripeptide--D-alanyl-D-alanine ligase [Saprospiraceae bacterium]MDW8229566.1 UDP-N-acetylmuramoyl-tripeptide--D-alanyl-D-alanine ligase [Saprospiraceae bacterium]
MATLEHLYAVYRQHPDVCTDSRRIRPGCLFWALKGERFDGNLFARAALEAGAAYCVIDRPDCQHDAERCLLVPDTLEMLQLLATHHRRHLEIPVLAIGGSNGKTTTKELITAVLRQQYACAATEGNLNNHIGVPLTLLAMPFTTEVAVVEMGTNQPGDLEHLCAIAQPTHGLLTNIGKEHLEGLGSIEGVKKAEGELFDYLAAHGGCAFVNLSEKYLKALAKKVQRKVFYTEISFDEGYLPRGVIGIQRLPPSPFVGAQFSPSPGVSVSIETHLLGQHNFHNVMTAIAVGLYFKVPAEKIKAAIEGYRPQNNRSQVMVWGSNTVFLDAYNANPSSMRAALGVLQEAKASQKIAILGDMLELGAAAEGEHRALIRYVERMPLAQRVFVGPIFGRCRPRGSRSLFFPDVASAREWLEAQHYERAFLLVKASRGIGLERLFAGSGEALQRLH